ncbi:transcriptional regulator CadC, partial [Serratia ureilytica]
IIVTYPRQGFKFNAASIQQMDIKASEINNNDYSETEIASTPPPARTPNFRRSVQRLIMIMAACLVPFAAIVLYQNSTRISVYP